MSKWNRHIDYSEDEEIEENRRFVNNTIDKYKKLKLNKDDKVRPVREYANEQRSGRKHR